MANLGERDPQLEAMSAPTGSWQFVGASVRGATHGRSGLCNQDALRWWPRSGKGPPSILAVADGHGSFRHFRSHIGARLAVNTARRVLKEEVLAKLVDSQAAPDLPAIKRTCEEWLPKVLVRAWRERVETHARRAPFSPAELAILAESDGEQIVQRVLDDPALAYGATLLALLVTETFLLYLQLGDGDILIVPPAGDVSRPPFVQDDRLIANQTTSLCMSKAWLNTQIYFQPLAGPPPALVLLATDGYANSFVNAQAFEQVGADLLASIRADGLASVDEQLGEWLRTTSEAGSGDDITVGLAYYSAHHQHLEQRRETTEEP